MRKQVFVMAAAVAMLAVACKKDSNEMVDNSLYAKLGGSAMVTDPANSAQMIEKGRLGLRSVVDSSIFVIAADPKMQPFFTPLLTEVTAGNTTNLAILSKNLTDFFCVATGAKNFTYNGLGMAAAHDPARNPRMAKKSTNADYDAFVADVVIGAQKNKVPTELIQEVGKLLETLRSVIVQQ